ncbi:MAG: CrcB family protein [Balneolales bacterium]|nr:CrcB family protein [Balneolales bacterium]
MSKQQPALFHKLCLIFAGGALGTGARFGLILLSGAEADRVYWVILAENLSGSFLLGYVSARLRMGMLKASPWAPFLGTGVLGSFTSFSAFSLDILNTAAVSFWMMSFYILSSFLGGITAVLFGLRLGLKQGRKIQK